MALPTMPLHSGNRVSFGLWLGLGLGLGLGSGLLDGVADDAAALWYARVVERQQDVAAQPALRVQLSRQLGQRRNRHQPLARSHLVLAHARALLPCCPAALLPARAGALCLLARIGGACLALALAQSGALARAATDRRAQRPELWSGLGLGFGLGLGSGLGLELGLRLGLGLE